MRDGDEYVIDGQKIFTTHAHDADYIWLAARTDPDAPKHKGISIILVPTRAPGLLAARRSTRSAASAPTSTYYEDVRVPVANRVGPGERGLALDHRRSSTTSASRSRRRASPTACSRRSWAWAARDAERPGGGRMLDEPWVQLDLARVYAQARGAQGPELALGLVIDRGRARHGGGVGGQGVRHRDLRRVLPAAARDQRQPPASCAAASRARSSAACSSTPTARAMTLTFGGGVNEVQRDIIAMAGLGLPRAAALTIVTEDVGCRLTASRSRSSSAAIRAFVGIAIGPPRAAPRRR